MGAFIQFKALNKAEQKEVNGGDYSPFCNTNSYCPDGLFCHGWACL
ncbi:MAG: hypothetical protein ABJH82_12525 [Polaribacter sp.]